MTLEHIIKAGMRAAFYARHSTAKQNIETQRAFVEKFIIDYDCKKITDEYLDENVSARKNKLQDRHSLMKLINDISLNKFDLVVVYQQDRLSRDPSEHLFLRSLFKQANIPIVVASTHTLYDSGDLLTNIFRDGLSQYEVETLRLRTRDTLETLHIQGLWTGGKPPFGYKYISKRNPIEADEYELGVVKEIFKLFNEKVGLQTIATIINKKYYTEMSKPYLNKQRIKRIILNPIYAGYLVHRKGQDIDSWHIVKTDLICKPILTFNEWMNNYTLYLTRKNESKNNIISNTNFFMRGLLYCSDCNQQLQHKNQINSKGHGSMWYFCKTGTCNYKLEVNELHIQCIEFVKILFYDFYEELMEHAAIKRQQLIELSSKRLDKLDHNIRKIKRTLQAVDTKINDATPIVTNIIENIDKSQKLTIIDMLKGYRKKTDDEYHSLLKQKGNAKRTKTMYESPNFITQVLKDLTPSDLELTDNELCIYQRLIIQLVEKMIVIPVGLPDKRRVLDHVELEIKLNSI